MRKWMRDYGYKPKKEKPKRYERQFPTSLNKFWKQYGGVKCDGRLYSYRQKIDELVRLAKIVIPEKERSIFKNKRDTFNTVKYWMHSLRKWYLCFACGGRAEIRHHIIALGNGGINTERNTVSLCRICHNIVHPHMNNKQEMLTRVAHQPTTESESDMFAFFQRGL